jgi:hypothetical protein
MRRQRRTLQRSAVAAALAFLLGSVGPVEETAWAAAPQYTTQFDLDECTFSSTGRNAHFSIRPGDKLVLEGEDDGELVRVQITVLNQTKKITFADAEGESLTVYARVVEEREWKNGALVEVSRNFHARCEQTDDVFYFGEEVDIYEDGVIVSHDGAWLAGTNGALPGLIMPGRFLLGSRYFQEIATDVALDRAEHVKMGLTVQTPAGTFEDCVEVLETTPLEPGATSVKRYCPEIGLVMDGAAKLVDFDIAGADD